MIAISIPFEGLNTAKESQIQFNRISEIQNGNLWKYFTGNSTYQSGNIFYQYALDSMSNAEYVLDLGHACGIEFPDFNLNGVWGFALYKISAVITNLQNNNVERYSFILNSLDSYLGDTLHTPYGDSIYKIGDFIIDYDPAFPENNRLHIYSNYGGFHSIDTINTSDTLANGFPKTEIKIWEIIRGYNQPVAEDFFARTTPFGLRPEIIDSMNVNEIFLGTKVILDKVYNNFGTTDRYGYNTRNDGNYYYYYSNPPVAVNEPGRTYVTPSIYNSQTEKCLKIILLINNKITLDTNKKLWISGNQTYNKGDEIYFSKNSQLTMKANSEINTFRFGKLTDSGSIKEFHPNSIIRAYENTEISFIGNQENHIINNSALVEIKGNAYLILGDNTTVTFDGEGTYLKLNPNSIVQLGNNAKIEFKNGAKLIADGSSFAAAPNSIWKGLYFENSGIDDIQNCTFSGAEYPIDIKCENANSALVLKTIKNNTFNITGTGKTAIKTNNAINLLIDDNTINMPSDLSNTPAIYLRNALSFSPNPGNSEEITNIRVVNNNINNGSNSIIIANYVSTFLPVYVDNNICYNSFSSPFIGRFITGTISNNNFDNQNKTYGKGPVIHQGNPGLFRNNIFSKDVALSLLSGASVNMSPSGDGSNQLLWTGGENDISSTVSHSTNFNQNSMANIDFGHNDFYKQDAASSHLYGSLLIQGTEYYARENCWYNTNYPVYNLVNNQGNQVNVIWQGGYYNCIDGISQIDSVMIDWGAGIYQYVPVSNLGQQQVIDQDELLYGQAVQQASIGSYPSAINLLKQLINDYQSSQYLSTALFDLYAYYEELDTTQSEGERDILYGNLKTYLNDRILTEQYDEQFESDAFYIIVMCEANMMNTQLAIDDYEFLSLYHPQPEVRLLASWDYTELEALYGQGGSMKEFKSEDEMTKYIDIISKKIEKKFKGDPLRNRLMKTYKKVNDEYSSKEENLNKELSRAGNAGKEKFMTQKAELDNRKEMNKTASTNLITLRGMSDKQKEERRFNDLMTISGIKNTGAVKSEISNIIPEKYELSQNYPNPFNPVTTIQFQVPSLKFVKLVVYDLLGREVKTLVNEYKQAGSYIVSFDGSKLSSGIYFYRLESGDYVQVRRMVLIK